MAACLFYPICTWDIYRTIPLQLQSRLLASTQTRLSERSISSPILHLLKVKSELRVMFGG